MNLLDLVLLIWLLYYAIRGLMGGLVRMALELIGLLVGISTASAFYRQLTALTEPLFLGFHNLAALFSYYVIYTAIYELFAYAIRWFDKNQQENNPLPLIKKFRTAFNGMLEKGGGMVVGLLKGNIVVGVAVVLLAMFPFDWLQDLMSTSIFVKYVVGLAKIVLPNLPIELGI